MMRRASSSCYNSITSLLFSSFFFSLLSLLTVYSSAQDVTEFGQSSPVEIRYVGRSLKQAALQNSSLVLAADQTTRPNPLDDFNTYKQGWNISSTNYWASVGFTAFPGFGLSVLWVVLGLLYLLFACCCSCCCPERARGKHERGVCFPLLLLFVFTASAMAGCVLVYVGQDKFHNELANTLVYIVNKSEGVVQNLRNITDALTKIESIDVGTYTLPQSEIARINQLNIQLKDAAITLETETDQNSDRISSGLDKVRKAMVVVATVMLLLVLLGLLFAVLGVRSLIHLLVFIGWLLVAGTWILCGVYILLNNAMGDTCVALQDWVNNPSAKTALDEILPCVDVNTANSSLDLSRELVNETTNGINSIIMATFSSSLPPLCNPMLRQLDSSNCVDFAAAPKAWESFVCTGSMTTMASTNGTTTCIPLEVYTQMNSSVSLIDSLFLHTPFLVDLQDCTFVRDAFSNIQQNHCRGLKLYSKWQYIGLALISSGTGLSILFWIIYIRRRRSNKRGHYLNEDPAYSSVHPIYGNTVQSDSKVPV